MSGEQDNADSRSASSFDAFVAGMVQLSDLQSTTYGQHHINKSDPSFHTEHMFEEAYEDQSYVQVWSNTQEELRNDLFLDYKAQQKDKGVEDDDVNEVGEWERKRIEAGQRKSQQRLKRTMIDKRATSNALKLAKEKLNEALVQTQQAQEEVVIAYQQVRELIDQAVTDGEDLDMVRGAAELAVNDAIEASEEARANNDQVQDEFVEATLAHKKALEAYNRAVEIEKLSRVGTGRDCDVKREPNSTQDVDSDYEDVDDITFEHSAFDMGNAPAQKTYDEGPLGGTYDEGPLGGTYDEGPLGGTYDEGPLGGTFDEGPLGGTYDGEPLGGTYDGEPLGGTYDGEPLGGTYDGEPLGGTYDGEPLGGTYDGEPLGGTYDGEPLGGTYDRTKSILQGTYDGSPKKQSAKKVKSKISMNLEQTYSELIVSNVSSGGAIDRSVHGLPGESMDDFVSSMVLKGWMRINGMMYHGQFNGLYTLPLEPSLGT